MEQDLGSGSPPLNPVSFHVTWTDSPQEKPHVLDHFIEMLTILSKDSFKERIGFMYFVRVAKFSKPLQLIQRKSLRSILAA